MYCEAEFDKLLREKHNNTIVRVTHFKSTLSPITVHCTVCGRTWSLKSAYSLIGNNARGCAKCHQRLKMTMEEFDTALKELYNNDIVRFSKFHGSNKNVTVQCNVCGYIWVVRGAYILYKRKYGCPNCRLNGEYPAWVRNIIRKPQKFDEMLERAFGKTVLRIGLYKNTSSPVKIRCLKCGGIFELSMSKLLCNPVGCAKCSHLK